VVPGFGELFRTLSYEDIGSAALLSRALAGLVGGKLVFVLPGSRGAVKLAMERLILPEIGHLAAEAVKSR
jgi:molybdenum cofactor biosynthesis protein B